MQVLLSKEMNKAVNDGISSGLNREVLLERRNADKCPDILWEDLTLGGCNLNCVNTLLDMGSNLLLKFDYKTI
jgi:hypothetical protein